jgi:putative endonuclease
MTAKGAMPFVHATHRRRTKRGGGTEPSASYNPRMAFVYMLRCRGGSLYTGIAKDVARRLERHQRGLASKYTRSRLPVLLVWKRRLLTWSLALKEECRIKSLTRAQKERLLAVATPARRARRTGPSSRGR